MCGDEQHLNEMNDRADVPLESITGTPAVHAGGGHMGSFIGFAWQGFGSREATGVASVRRCQKLPLCPIEPMPAGSKMDPPLAKAEPISNDGSASGIT